MATDKVYKISKRTGKIVRRFRNPRAAFEDAEKEGVASQYRCMYVMLKQKTFSSKSEYFYRYKTDYVPHESFEGKSNAPIILCDLQTGHYRWYASTLACGKEFYLTSRAVSTMHQKKSLLMGKYLIKKQKFVAEPSFFSKDIIWDN